MKKKKRKINFQKIFSFMSLIFIIVCIFWYGGRLIYFYQDSKKTTTTEINTFAKILKTENQKKETFKLNNDIYYFYGDVSNNYLEYSNMTWRIIKINKDDSISLINENIISILPFGEKNTYQDSTIIKWLNQTNEEEYTFDNKLNQKEKYLTKSNICIDNIEDLEKATCKTTENQYNIGLLSIQDYIHTGGKNSFINNGRYTYLSNTSKEETIWYINEEGQLDTTETTEFLGIKPIITLSSKVELKTGTGTKEDPYKIEDTKSTFASYAKLGNDIWRIYEEKDNIIKLILNEPLKVEDEIYQSSYSKNNYYHNDTTYASLAYYLNNTYLKSLDYQSIILENTYVNGYYGIDNQFNYQDILENTIETKVSLPSIGDVILNDTLNNYFTNTGISKDSFLIYIMKEKGSISTKNVATEANVVPCISIQKENLKAGSGTLTDPYRLEP